MKSASSRPRHGVLLDLKDRPQLAVLLADEGGAQQHADQRRPRHGDVAGPGGGGRGRVVADGLGDGAADQVHSAEQGNARLRHHALGRGQQALEHAAGIRQADDHDVVGIGNVVAEQRPHDAQPHVLAHRLVRRVTAGARHAGQEGEKPPFLDFENALRRQAGQRLVANVVALLGDVRHPEAGRARRLGLGDFGQHGVQQVIVQRRRVQQRQGVGVRVDTAFQGRSISRAPASAHARDHAGMGMRSPRLSSIRSNSSSSANRSIVPCLHGVTSRTPTLPGPAHRPQ